MSAAEYRIVVVHDVTDAAIPYGAEVYNLAGDRLTCSWGTTREQAERSARDYVQRLGTTPEPPVILWVDGAGRDAVAPPVNPEGAS